MMNTYYGKLLLCATHGCILMTNCLLTYQPELKPRPRQRIAGVAEASSQVCLLLRISTPDMDFFVCAELLTGGP